MEVWRLFSAKNKVLNTCKKYIKNPDLSYIAQTLQNKLIFDYFLGLSVVPGSESVIQCIRIG